MIAIFECDVHAAHPNGICDVCAGPPKGHSSFQRRVSLPSFFSSAGVQAVFLQNCILVLNNGCASPGCGVHAVPPNGTWLLLFSGGYSCCGHSSSQRWGNPAFCFSVAGVQSLDVVFIFLQMACNLWMLCAFFFFFFSTVCVCVCNLWSMIAIFGCGVHAAPPPWHSSFQHVCTCNLRM